MEVKDRDLRDRLGGQGRDLAVRLGGQGHLGDRLRGQRS